MQVLYKIITTLIIATTFISCGSDEESTPYIPYSTPDLKVDTKAQEQLPQGISYSELQAPELSTFAYDMQFFNIRGENERRADDYSSDSSSESSDDGGDYDSDSDGGDYDSDSDGGDYDDNDNNDRDSNGKKKEDKDYEELSNTIPEAPEWTNDNYNKTGYMNVFLQGKEYHFTVAEYRYWWGFMPTLTTVADGTYFLAVTGYLIDMEYVDLEYGMFTLEVYGVDIEKTDETVCYPISKNIFTNSALNPASAMACIDVVRDGNEIKLDISVEPFLLYDRTQTQVYKASFRVIVDTHYYSIKNM